MTAAFSSVRSLILSIFLAGVFLSASLRGADEKNDGGRLFFAAAKRHLGSSATRLAGQPRAGGRQAKRLHQYNGRRRAAVISSCAVSLSRRTCASRALFRRT